MTGRTLDDGLGSAWEKCAREDCALEIVRPGKVQCDRCSYENVQAVTYPLPATEDDTVSEPRHIYVTRRTDGKFGLFYRDNPDCCDPRYTRTEGPEWDAMMERARATFRESKSPLEWAEADQKRRHVLRDLLNYFGETP